MQLRVFQKGGYPGDSDHVLARMNVHASIALYKPLCLSLPSIGAGNSPLASRSSRSDKYFITRVIQCPPDPRWPGSDTTPLCTFATPLIWRETEMPEFLYRLDDEEEYLDERAHVVTFPFSVAYISTALGIILLLNLLGTY